VIRVKEPAIGKIVEDSGFWRLGGLVRVLGSLLNPMFNTTRRRRIRISNLTKPPAAMQILRARERQCPDETNGRSG
jgi:hypothetical protein